MEGGSALQLPAVDNWKSDGPKATSQRKARFEALVSKMKVAGAEARMLPGEDAQWRSANVAVQYSACSGQAMPPTMKPYVLLEIGVARVTPHVNVDLSSLVHDYLENAGQLQDYTVNKPVAVRCVHPLVTLLEKLDSIQNRLPRGDDAATFVRHFEDCARITTAAQLLPELPDYASVRVLAQEMAEQKQIKRVPKDSDLAFNPDTSERWKAVEAAHRDIHQMFWGARIPLVQCCAHIRLWIQKHL